MTVKRRKGWKILVMLWLKFPVRSSCGMSNYLNLERARLQHHPHNPVLLDILKAILGFWCVKSDSKRAPGVECENHVV